MPIKDQVTHHSFRQIMNAAIASNTTTNSEIIDTEGAPLGLTFAAYASAYTDGTYAFSFQHGEQANLSDAETVPAESFVNQENIPNVTAAAVAGALVGKAGLFSLRRYVRVVVTSTGVTSGATLQIVAMESPDVIPAP